MAVRYEQGDYVSERRNPLVRSPKGGRLLSALQLPWFATLPPRGFGVITVTGRRSGKARRKCVRAIRAGDKAYLVAIGGPKAAWRKNVAANPRVSLRLRGGWSPGVVRAPQDGAEAGEAMAAFCRTVNPFDYVECCVHRRGRPTRAKIVELHRAWFDGGTPLIVDLQGEVP